MARNDKEPSVKQRQVASMLQASVSRFFIEHSKDWGIGSMILVDDVFVPTDLKSAQIWISFSPRSEKMETIWFERITKNQKELDSYLYKNVEMRRIPKLSLKLSDPDKTFKLFDIFGTLGGHENQSSSDFNDPTEE